MKNSPNVKTANVFVSSAWKHQFLNVVDAHRMRFGSDESKVYLEFDLFSNNQHGVDPSPPLEWWCETFRSAIRDLGHAVMIIGPWNNPIPLTRVWCLWEVYCAHIRNTKFEV